MKRDAFFAGQEARLSGLARFENPFPVLSRSYLRWDAGWNDLLRPFPLTRGEHRELEEELDEVDDWLNT